MLVGALALRLLPNDAYALSSAEGSRALAGWRLLSGAPQEWWGAPALASILAAVFLAFGDNDFVARLPAALAGVAVLAALIPWRARLGRWPALAAAGLLAISPTGLSLDRTVHEAGIATAIGFGMANVMLNHWDRTTRWIPPVLGIGTALLLSLGSAGISVLLSLGLFGVLRYTVAQSGTGGLPAWLKVSPLAVVPAIAVFIVVAKGGFQNLDGAAWASLADWVRQFDTGAETPWFERWLFLAHAETLALGLGGVVAAVALVGWLTGSNRASTEAKALFAVWGALNLVFYGLSASGPQAIAYEVSLPLTVLGGATLGHAATALRDQDVRRALSGILPALGVLGVFGALTALDIAAGAQSLTGNRVAAMGLATVLAILCCALLYTSAPHPALCLTLAAGALGGILTVHAAGRAITGELWPRDERVDGVTIMAITSQLPPPAHGTQLTPKSVAAANSLQGALAWYLRKTPSARFADPVPTGADLAISLETELSSQSARRRPLIRTLAAKVPWTPAKALVWAMTGRLPDGAEAVIRIAVVSKG